MGVEGLIRLVYRHISFSHHSILFSKFSQKSATWRSRSPFVLLQLVNAEKSGNERNCLVSNKNGWLSVLTLLFRKKLVSVKAFDSHGTRPYCMREKAKERRGVGWGKTWGRNKRKNGALRRNETIFIHIEQDTCSSFSRALYLQIAG